MRFLRTLSRHHGYAALAVLTLTLTVGANLVVFTIVNALWLRPRPVAHPDRVVVITNLPLANDKPIDALRMPMLDGFRRLSVFDGVAGQLAAGGLMGDFAPRIVINRVGHSVETLAITSDYFSVLGVGVRGREFTAGEDRAGSPVAIISDRLWRSAFSGAPNVIGAAVPTSRMPLDIIGVAPAGFLGARLGEQIDLWIPRGLIPRVSALPQDGSRQIESSVMDFAPLLGLARLRPGVTSADAERAIARPRTRYIVRPLSGAFGTPTESTVIVHDQTVLRLLIATAGLLLLAGCTTLAALVLVHYERRRQELAVRLALGATRRDLVGQLSVELSAIGAAGLLTAMVMTTWAIRALPALTLPGGIDLGRLDLTIDWRVATIGVLAAAATLALATTLPIVRLSRGPLVLSLVSPTTTGAPSSLRLRRVMLGVHIAATLIVLIAAGLFMRTIAYGFGVGPGFDLKRTAFLEVQPSLAEFYRADEKGQEGSDARKASAYRLLLEKLNALPGVEIAAIGQSPLEPDLGIAAISIPVIAEADLVARPVRARIHSDAPGFLTALGARLVAGRVLTAEDAAANEEHAVVTASFASLFWPASPAVGRTLTALGHHYRIVGVVSDVVCYSLRTPSCASIFTTKTRTDEQLGRGVGGLAVTLRSRTAAADLVAPVRQIAAAIFPNASQLNVRTASELVALDLGQERLGLWFFSGFGAVALLLGVTGVFGLVAYLAESKRREFGLRMALGATHASLRLGMVLTGLWPVALGSIAGLGVAGVFTRVFVSALIGVPPVDVITYAGAAAIMLGAALVGGVAAAWRINRLSPIEALRLL